MHTASALVLFAILTANGWGQKTWRGTSGDGLWTTASNWSGNAVPTDSDDVVLDNTNVPGSYTVTIPVDSSLGKAVVRTIRIGYTGNPNTITLYFASNAIVEGFKFGDSTKGSLDFCVDEGGVFINASYAAKGSSYIQQNDGSDSLRVKSGGKFVQVTTRSFSEVFGNSNSKFDEGSTFELNARAGGNATLTVNDRSWGNYIIAADSAGGTRGYSAASGKGAFTVLDTWTVKSGVTLNPWTTSGTHSVRDIIFDGSMSHGKAGGFLNISGDVTVNGTWTTSDSQEVTFNGSSAQVIAGSVPITFNNGFTINNAAGVSLATNVTLNDTLAFAAGSLTTGDDSLTLGPTACVIGEASGKYVVGNLTKTEAVGTNASSSLNSIGVSVDAGPDDLGTVTVNRLTGESGVVTVAGKSGIARRWNITSPNPPNAGRNLTLSWISDDDHGKTATELRHAQVYRSTDNGSSWIAVGSGQDASASRSVTVVTTSFSQWSVSDLYDNPLPVTMKRSTATVDAGRVRLNFTTATEIGVVGFTISRATAKAGPFQVVSSYSSNAALKAMGSATAGGSYEFVDAKVSAEHTYYYSIIAVSRSGMPSRVGNVLEVEVTAPKEFAVYQNYPNPFNPTTSVRFDLKEQSNVTIEVYNVLGLKVRSQSFRKDAGTFEKQLDFSGMPSGIYYLRTTINGSPGNNFVSTKKALMVK